MKVLSLAITAIVLAGSQAKADQVVNYGCEIQFAGTFKSMPDADGSTHFFKIDQNKCLLKITESTDSNHNLEKTVWNVDLSGETEFMVPQSIVDANKSSVLGTESLKSLRGRLQFVAPPIGSGVGDYQLGFKLKSHLPVAEKNRVDCELSIAGSIRVMTGYQSNVVRMIQFNPVKVRVTEMNSPVLLGPVKSAFIKGANSVLSFLDDVNANPMVSSSLTYMVREN